MATKSQTIIAGDTTIRPMADERSWARSNGTYIAGRAYLDEADQTAAAMEAKWGADRLRILVPPDLREKFDRQRYLLNQAVWHGELEAVRQQSGRMVRAYEAADRAATMAGKQPLSPQVWEIALGDGSVAAIVPDHDHAREVIADGRQVAVYTLEEIARLLTAYPSIVEAKIKIPGATVTQIKRSIDDPLNAIHDSKTPLDDPIPDFA